MNSDQWNALNWAEKCKNDGDFTAADNVYKNLLDQIQQDYAKVKELRGDLQFAQGNFRLAKEHYEMALLHMPHFVDDVYRDSLRKKMLDTAVTHSLGLGSRGRGDD